MAQSSQLPPFGNWESEENYTAYFENARKKKGGGRMNPNDSQDNMPPVRAPPLEQEVELKGQMGTAAIRSKHERQKSHEDGQLQRLAHSPLHHGGVGPMPAVDDLSRQLRSGSSKVKSEAPKGSDVKRPQRGSQLSREEGELRRPKDSLSQHETVGRRATVDSPYRLQGGPSTCETPKRVSRQSAGSDPSSDNSPLHGHFQARIGGKVSGVSSPSWEKKVSSEGLAPCTPGRSRLRSVTRGDDSPDHGPAVPKFGDWDESDPASAEGFSEIFDKARVEKQIAAGKVPEMATETPYSNGQRQPRNDNSKSCCCFPWVGK